MEIIKRKIFIGGNWKCNGDRAFVNKYCMFLTSIKVDQNKVELCLAPPDIHLTTCKTFLGQSFNIASQNISEFEKEKYTGEINGKQLKDIGIDWTIIGHSERRILFKENEQVIQKKLKNSLSAGLNIIFCIGDNLEDYQSGNSYKKIDEMMDTVFNNINDQWEKIVLVYEPVWTVNTGQNISCEKAQETHQYIRDLIRKKKNDDIANKIRIVYGGDINENNCKDFICQKDIDGFLVGEISLTQSFSQIIESIKYKKWE